jgi:hypothetical protein
MRFRNKLSGIAATGLIVSISVAGFAGIASADTGSNGTTVSITLPSDAANTTILQNDEPVRLIFPNGDLDANTNYQVEECQDPTGNVTAAFLDKLAGTSCDANAATGYTSNAQGGLTTPDPTVAADKAGTGGGGGPGFNNAYIVYSLPDAPYLGETNSNGAVCDLSDECILVATPNGLNDPADGAGVAYSDPFFVNQNYDYLAGRQAPSPVVPEAPYGIFLPIAAAGLLGGAYVVVRRRRKVAVGV